MAADRGAVRMVRTALRTSWRADPRGTVVAAATQVVGALSSLGVVLATKLALDSLLGGQHKIGGRLLLALLALALASVLTGSVGTLQQQQQRLLGERVSQLLWSSLLRVCGTVSLETWNDTSFMDRLERVRSNALSRPVSVVSSLFVTLGSLLGVVALTVALLGIEPLLVPVLLAAGVPAVLVARWASRSEFAFATRSNANLRRRVYLKTLLTGRSYAAEIRAFGSGPNLLHRHAADDRAFAEDLAGHVRRRQGMGLASVAFSALALSVAMVIIVSLVDAGRMSLAQAGAAAIATRLLGSQLSGVFSSLSTLIESQPFLEDMDSFLGQPAEFRSGTPRELSRELRTEGVWFRYGASPEPALRDVSIEVPAGHVVALVGENGSGKTTLAKVMAGLYTAERGEVEWDGAAIPDDDLRASVAVLFQDFVKYQLTAGENIAISRATRDVDEDELRAAARQAGVDAVIEALPQGYDTGLGLELSEGSDLSGGQWQRLALARAFYRDSPVIVLDEPTAALDPRAEQALFQDVRRMMAGKAVLLITHRYSSVRLADYVYVMHAGRVTEQGTHDQLMRHGGRYAELYALQAAAYLADPEVPQSSASTDRSRPDGPGRPRPRRPVSRGVGDQLHEPR